MKLKLLSVVAIGVGLLAVSKVIRAAMLGDKNQPSATAHTYVLEASQVIPAPLDEVFPFFEDPRNLGVITPPGMGFEILEIENLPMQRGTTIEYRIKPLGIPQRWSTKIVEYKAGRGFADLQLAGPYRYWHHRHTFEEDGNSTIMRDRVEYQMPFSVLGRVLHWLVVKRQLQAIFAYRNDVVGRLFPKPARVRV